jgi:hypothetical protein
MLEVDFTKARAFGDPAVTGISGAPESGRAVVTADLADRLRVASKCASCVAGGGEPRHRRQVVAAASPAGR